MQKLKECVHEIPEGLDLSEGIGDDLLMVNGYRFKMVGTCWHSYC